MIENITNTVTRNQNNTQTKHDYEPINTNNLAKKYYIFQLNFYFDSIGLFFQFELSLIKKQKQKSISYS